MVNFKYIFQYLLEKILDMILVFIILIVCNLTLFVIVFFFFFLMGFRIVVGLVTILTIVGSGYEMVLERRKAREFKKRQIAQGNNNESDSKVEFTLDKMQAIEKMQNMKACGNDNGTLDEPDMLFKGNISYNYYVFNELKINIYYG